MTLIYTVTFNPSLDYIVRMDHFEAGAINRVSYEQVLAGGKGINVSPAQPRPREHGARLRGRLHGR